MFSSVTEKSETGTVPVTSSNSPLLSSVSAVGSATSAFSPLDLRGSMINTGMIMEDDDGVESDCSADINVDSDDEINLHGSPSRRSPTSKC